VHKVSVNPSLKIAFTPWNFRSLAYSLPGPLAPWHLRSRALSLPGPLVPLVHDVDARIPNDRRTLLLMRTCSLERG